MNKTEYPSETAKYLHLTAGFCWGCGVDIGSQGSGVVPWAFNFDLPPDEFAFYNSGNQPRGPIQLRGDAHKLPFDSDSLAFVYSSHLLEDFLDWEPVLREWVRVIKPGGYLIILVPDKELWAAALAKGQPPNCAHTHESHVGELTAHMEHLPIKPMIDRLTNCFEGDYSILFVGEKL
jgi:SAM-dependent methyltransferase